jgi:hypothetical protein
LNFFFLSQSHIAGCGFIKLGRVNSDLLFWHYNFLNFFLSFTLGYYIYIYSTNNSINIIGLDNEQELKHAYITFNVQTKNT